jgi:hypothetical protein
MPGNNSWNGKWTGDGKFYARVRNVGSTTGEAILNKQSYGYNFGDGWFASIAVKQVTAKEAAKIRKNTKGFWGYEWMIDSICKHGKIQARGPVGQKGNDARFWYSRRFSQRLLR